MKPTTTNSLIIDFALSNFEIWAAKLNEKFENLSFEKAQTEPDLINNFDKAIGIIFQIEELIDEMKTLINESE